MVVFRKNELNKYQISPRQLYVLHVIDGLGPKATASEICKIVARDIHVITRLSIDLEKEGYIKRVKNTPKSKILNFVLTEKGAGMLKISWKSKKIDRLLASIDKKEYQQMESTLIEISNILKRNLKT
jgi:DNA-binding MarR family transcriptional regulator